MTNAYATWPPFSVNLETDLHLTLDSIPPGLPGVNRCHCVLRHPATRIVDYGGALCIWFSILPICICRQTNQEN